MAHRHPDTGEDDTASTDSYSTTPTPPGTPADVQQHQLMVSGSPYMIVPQQQRQMMSNQVYQGHMPPVQYVPGQGYVTYSPYTQYVTVPEPGLRYPQSHTPPVQQARSPSPIMIGNPYLANPSPVQTHIGRSGPAQTPPYTRTPPPSTSPYIRNPMPGSMPGGAVMMQMGGQSAAPPTGGSVVGGNIAPSASPTSQTHWRGQQSRRGGKGANGWNHEMMNYQALAQEGQRVQQNIASFSAQNRPPVVKMIQVPPHFPLMTGQR